MGAADLDEGDLVEAGVGVGAYRLDEGVDVVAARDRGGDVLTGDAARGPVEGDGARKLGVDRPGAERPAELLVGAGERGLAVGVVGDGELADAGFARAAETVEVGEESRLGLGGDDEVGEAAGEGAGAGSGDGDADRRGGLGQVPQLGVLDAEVLPVVVDGLAVEQGADDADGLLQHLDADPRGRPAAPDDVLVEVLAGAEAETEAALRQELDGRGLLGDDRRVVAHGRAGHVRHERQALGGLRDGAEDAPGVGRVALFPQPGEVVVGHDGEVESGLLGTDRVRHQLAGACLFGHEGVSDTGHGTRCDRADGMSNPKPAERVPDKYSAVRSGGPFGGRAGGLRGGYEEAGAQGRDGRPRDAVRRDVGGDAAVVAVQVVEEVADDGLGGASVVLPAGGATPVARGPVGAQPRGGVLGEGEVGGDGVAVDAEEGEDERGDDPGAVLAGGAVEDGGALGVREDVDDLGDLLAAVREDLAELVGEVPPGVGERPGGGLVPGAVLDAEVMEGESLARGDAAGAGDLPAVAQVDDGADAERVEARAVGDGRGLVELGEVVGAVEHAAPRDVSPGGAVAAQVTEVVQAVEGEVSVHGR
ncbi:putative oxidoreductase [Streptomyces sp. Tu6071]|nr:putative oxidoreductase [Streptomyces sp. Tu6071]